MEDRHPDPKLPSRRDAIAGIVLPAVAIGLLTFALHASALSGWWRFDDPWLLVSYVLEHRDGLAYFLSPARWQSLGIPFYTPWAALEFRLDHALFGADPAGFYLHHLLTLALIAVLTGALMAGRFGWVGAGASAVLFLAGAPTIVLAQQLMSRHYATGLLFAIIALGLWRRHVLKPHGLLLFGASLSFLIALLNKEVFLPLPLLFLLLDPRPIAQRLRAMAVPAATGIAFVIWRGAMIGAVVGGYGNRLLGPAEIAGSVVDLLEIFFGAGPRAIAGAVLVVAALAVVVARSDARARLLALGAAVAALAPFLAVRASADPVDYRLAFVPWWAVCVLLGAALGTLAQTRRRWIAPLGAVVAAATLVVPASIATSGAIHAIAREFDAQGRYLWHAGPSERLVPSFRVAIMLSFQYGVARSRQLLTAESSPALIPMPQFEHESIPASPGVHRYDPACQCVVPARADSKGPVREHGMLRSVSMDRRGSGFAWSFEVPQGTACHLVFPSLRASMICPCAGHVVYGLPSWIAAPAVVVAVGPSGQVWDASPLIGFPSPGEREQWSVAP
jgi:hypothetical protein